MKKFYVFNTGCIRRALDTIRIQQYLEVNEWEHTEDLGEADLVVLSTCGVVRSNETRSLNAISRAKANAKPGAEIVVSGCLPKIDPDKIAAIGQFPAIPVGQHEEFDDFIQARVPFRAVKEPDSIADNPNLVNYMVARSFCRRSRLYTRLFNRFSMSAGFLRAAVAVANGYTRLMTALRLAPPQRIVPYYNINIGDGCRSGCTFCATRLATGVLKSKPVDQVLAEFRAGLAKGYQYFQLIAEDTGCYGMDSGTSLPGLMARMFEHEGDYQLIVVDYNPRWLVKHQDELMRVIERHPGKIRELFVPLQSGSDGVLKRMLRKYTAAETEAVLRKINEKAPDIRLRTSILVGFPGESEGDFDATKRLLDRIRFYEVTLNKYEDRPNTRSATMSGKLDDFAIERRAQVLVEEFGARMLS